MKYKNAQEILPDKLLKELQQYVSGETLYVPSKTQKSSWGEQSGARSFYRKRNEEIRAGYQNGTKTEALAEEYGLSIETIRKILYQ